MKKIAYLILLFVIAVASCKKDQETQLNSYKQIDASSAKRDWRKAYYKGELITYEKKNDRNIFLGDIVIPDEELTNTPQKGNTETQGAGLNGFYGLWPDRTMKYEIDPNTSLSRKNDIKKAMANWAKATGFKFEDVSQCENKGDHVYIFYSNLGNTSYIGRIGGRQFLTLENEGVGVIVHELGHALGMFHEQQRSDRDKYITINWDNIVPDWQPQFLSYTFADNLLENAPCTCFDYNSIMLYNAYQSHQVAIDPAIPVMTKKNGEIWGDNVYHGTHAPSATDAKWVKVRYNIK